MLRHALHKYNGLRIQIDKNLLGDKGDIWETELKKFLRQEPCWTTEEKFIASSKFICDTSDKALVKISYLGDNFRNWHLNSVENIVSPAKLSFIVLAEPTYDKDIIVKFGGVSKAVTSLADIYSKMTAQPLGPKSPKGDLLTNGFANIFYVPQAVKKLQGNKFSYVNQSGKTVIEEVTDAQYLFKKGDQWFVLRTVFVFWRDGGWDVKAYSVGSAARWSAGHQVFSRNSVLESSEPSASASMSPSATTT